MPQTTLLLNHLHPISYPSKQLESLPKLRPPRSANRSPRIDRRPTDRKFWCPMTKLAYHLARYLKQTRGNYQLVNYFLPISHYNWQLKVICPFNEYISFNSTSFDQLVCQLLLILLLLIYSNSNLMGLINYFLLDLIFCFWPYICNLGQKSLRQESFFSHSETF